MQSHLETIHPHTYYSFEVYELDVNLFCHERILTFGELIRFSVEMDSVLIGLGALTPVTCIKDNHSNQHVNVSVSVVVDFVKGRGRKRLFTLSYKCKNEYNMVV